MRVLHGWSARERAHLWHKVAVLAGALLAMALFRSTLSGQAVIMQDSTVEVRVGANVSAELLAVPPPGAVAVRQLYRMGVGQVAHFAVRTVATGTGVAVTPRVAWRSSDTSVVKVVGTLEDPVLGAVAEVQAVGAGGARIFAVLLVPEYVATEDDVFALFWNLSTAGWIQCVRLVVPPYTYIRGVHARSSVPEFEEQKKGLECTSIIPAG